LEQYSEDKYYVDPKNEESKIDGAKNALTIPIMKFLDNLSNKGNEQVFNPTKFVTFVCLRKDEKYCSQIFSSIEFSLKIKSS
jgi:hypothetical protein